MSVLRLKVITPKKIVLDEEVNSVTVPGADGELTILPKHANIFALLKEGIVTIRQSGKEDFMAIGGGYLETDGESITILVSRAYGQDEIDQNMTETALKSAKEILIKSKDKNERIEAESLLRRSIIDSKLLKKRRTRGV